MNEKEKAGQHSNLPCCPARYHYFLMGVRLSADVLFGEGTVKIDILSMTNKTAAQRQPQTGAQQQRVRFGREEQQNERAMSFVMK